MSAVKIKQNRFQMSYKKDEVQIENGTIPDGGSRGI